MGRVHICEIMLSSVGLEVMNSTNLELSWKSVTKGRRSKKSVSRSLNSIVKVGDSISLKKSEDFSGSDSDKFGEVIPGQGTSGKSENVPLKKRRHLLQSPSPLEDRIQLQYPSCSPGDFFGIELLAAAASMDDEIDDAYEKAIPLEDSSVLKNSDASSSPTLSERCLKNNELVDSSSNINVSGGNADSQENFSSTAYKSFRAIPEDGTVLKVDRKHWDLNTSMDAWDEPCDVPISKDTLKDVNGGRHTEEMEKPTVDEKQSLKVEQDQLTSVAEDGICCEPPHLKENLLDPPTSIYSHTVRDTSNQACDRDTDDKNLVKATCDVDLKRSNEVKSLDAIGRSPFSKPCCSSEMLISEEKNNAMSGTVSIIQDGDCSSNMSECERTAVLNDNHAWADDGNAHNMVASESAIDIKPENVEISQKTSSPGTFTIDAQPRASTDSNKQIDGAFVSNSTIFDCKQHLEPAEHGTIRDGDFVPPNEDLKRTILVDTCKSSSAGSQSDEPNIVGGIGLALEQCIHDISQDNNVDMVDGDDQTGFQEGYDSPYEDGELRGSLSYSWEDNEMENECVDYESDGRNGDGSIAADHLGSEIVEDGSEGSNESRRSLSLIISAEGKSKSGSVKHVLKKHVVNGDSDSIEIARKGSNAGSGSTVEQCVEMPIDKNDGKKRLELVGHKNALDVRVTHRDEYASKAVKGKLLSRIEERSLADATDDRYPCRHRSAASGESGGGHQWTASWCPRRRYSTTCQGGEGHNSTRSRSRTGESANKIDGADYHQPRHTSYPSKGLHRPIIRSPVEGDDYFGVGRTRRIPLTRGVGYYRSRGHYSPRPGRDFVEDFEHLTDDAGASVRMPHYNSRRDRSFSLGSGRQARTTFIRRRSRSRSTTRSPSRAWQNPHRERILGARRLSRSPDFRSDSRMERARMPFSKLNFSCDYGEGYISPSRGRFSQQKCRWVEDHNFSDNHIRRRRSPGRVVRRTERFDGGRLKADEYFRPAIRPGRLSFKGDGGREWKFESSYDDRRRDDGGEMRRRAVYDGGNMRRFRQNTDLETKNMNVGGEEV